MGRIARAGIRARAGEVDRQQLAAGLERAARLRRSRGRIVEEVQHLVQDDGVGGAVGKRHAVQIAVARLRVGEPGALELRCARRPSMSRLRSKPSALGGGPRTARACARCRCRDRRASVKAPTQAPRPPQPRPGFRRRAARGSCPTLRQCSRNGFAPRPPRLLHGPRRAHGRGRRRGSRRVEARHDGRG